VLALGLLLATPACEKKSTSPAPAPVKPPPKADVALQVVIDTSMGEIVVELDEKQTPITVQNFLQYADDGFYDNTIFHRVMKGFMIQGGGFSTDLQKKPTRGPIKNEVKQARGNKRGTIAMARTGDHVDTATCQFYINHMDNDVDAPPRRSLDTFGGGYCTFGHVVSGLDIVDKIAAVKTHNRGGPFKDLPVEQIVIRTIRRK